MNNSRLIRSLKDLVYPWDWNFILYSRISSTFKKNTPRYIRWFRGAFNWMKVCLVLTPTQKRFLML